MGAGPSHHHHYDHHAEEEKRRNHERWVHEQNEKRRHEERVLREDMERIKRENEEKRRVEEENNRKAREEILERQRKLEEETRRAKEEHERRMREEDEKRRKVEEESKRLEEERKKIMEENARKNEEERKKNEEIKRKMEEEQQRNEEEKKRMEEERIAMEKKVEEELRIAQSQQRELEEEMKRVQEEEIKRQREDAERKAQEEIEIQRREEEVRIAKEKAEAEREAREKADQEKQRVQQELEESMQNLEMGIQPVVWPTDEERQSIKDRLQYRDKHFHFAISGQAGSGKSSLINAFRGMKNNDPGAAKTGVTETTQEIGRYPDPDSQPPRAWTIWFDVPGAGTLDIPDWQYFNQQGLFIFDLIIVAVDIRLTKIDLSIIENCRRFKIPSFIVRSKADQHIRNVMKDAGYDSDDDEQDHRELKRQARDKFITETRQSFASVLKRSGLPPQRTYIVSNDNLWAIIKGKKPKAPIDELELVDDLLTTVEKSRQSLN